MKNFIKNGLTKLNESVDSSSLAFFRIVFGVIMLASQIRFVAKGWVDQLYIQPKFFFKYYGFHWVQPLHGNWMYLPWALIIVSLVFIVIGKYYRTAIIVFFLLFSYTELLDLTNYLNHYYLITLLSFIMIFLPMNASFSLDAKKWNQPTTVPRWTLVVLQLQVGLVYFFAGIAKIKYDWLIEAQPLKIWLGTCQNIPAIGSLLAMPITAYIFSWAGMLFDITAPFFLLNKRTRPYEYALIVIFHLITYWLFYIGIFPLVMMGVALIFFSSAFHRNVLEAISKIKSTVIAREERQKQSLRYEGVDCFATARNDEPFLKWLNKKTFAIFFGIYFLWQVFMPFRYLFYKGNVLWTEQSFRYSWNVMLMEKNGYVEFYVEDKITGKRYIEYPKKNLTSLQEKMMSTQPDMILQYAHFLANDYQNKLQHEVAVYADAYVSLNKRQGQAFIDSKTDLSKEQDSFAPKNWILSLK